MATRKRATRRVTPITDSGLRTLKPQVGMPMISPLARHGLTTATNRPSEGEDG